MCQNLVPEMWSLQVHIWKAVAFFYVLQLFDSYSSLLIFFLAELPSPQGFLYLMA